MRGGERGLVRLLRLAAWQDGLVTSRQAGQVGVSPSELSRMTRGGLLERVRHGVYRAEGAPPQVREGLKAAWMSLDPALVSYDRLYDPRGLAVVSHASAAAVHGLGDIAADMHEFTLTCRKRTRDPEVRLHRRAATPDWTIVDGLPVTTVLQTITDLAVDQIDGGHLGGVVRDAVVDHRLPLDRLLPVLGRATRAYWGAQSDGREFLQILLHNAGLPRVLGDVVELMAGTADWQPRAA